MHLISLKYCSYDLRLGHHTNHGCLTNLSSLLWRWSAGRSHFSRENLGDVPNVGQWGQIGKHLIQLLIFLMFPSNLSMLSHLSFQQANCVSDGRLISSKALWKATSKIEYGSNFLDSQQLYNIQIYHLQWILSRYMILSWHRDFDPWPRYNAFDGCWWGFILLTFILRFQSVGRREVET